MGNVQPACSPERLRVRVAEYAEVASSKGFPASRADLSAIQAAFGGEFDRLQEYSELVATWLRELWSVSFDARSGALLPIFAGFRVPTSNQLAHWMSYARGAPVLSGMEVMLASGGDRLLATSHRGAPVIASGAGDAVHVAAGDLCEVVEAWTEIVDEHLEFHDTSWRRTGDFAIISRSPSWMRSGLGSLL